MIPQVIWQPGRFSWLILAAALVLLVQALFTWRRLGPDVGRVRARVLLGLRLAAITFLALASFRPSLITQAPKSGPQRLVVMLDNSRSMNTVDRNRTTTQLVDFAYVTGAIDPSISHSDYREILPALNQLVVETRQLPSESTPSNADAAKIAVVRSKIAEIQQVCRDVMSLEFVAKRLSQLDESIDAVSRRAEALGDLDDLIAEVRRRHDGVTEEWAELDEDTQEQMEQMRSSSRFDLARSGFAYLTGKLVNGSRVEAQLMQTPVRISDVPTAVADQTETPLLRTLRSTVERIGSPQLDGIVLLTDGRSTESRASIPPVLSAAGVPVFPVLMTPATRQTEVRVLSVEAPGKARLGETVQIVVRIRARDAEGRVVNVRLTDGRFAQSRSLTAGPADDSVRFDFVISTLGTVRFEAWIDPVAGEALAGNVPRNSETVVRDEKIKVAMLGRELSQEGRAIDQMLMRLPWVHYTRDVRSAGDACQISPQDLSGQDIIFLAGTPLTSLSAPQTEAILAAVLQQSKSVIVVDTRGDNLTAYLANGAFARLLGAASNSAVTRREVTQQEVIPIPSQQAARLSLMDVDANPETNLRNWMARPKMKRSVDLTPVLRSGVGLLMDRQSRIPLVAEVFVGGGRSVVFGIDQTHVWQPVEHEQFWVRIIRHLVDPAYDVSDRELSLAVDRDEVAVGRPIEIFCRSRSPSAGPVQLTLRQPDRSLETITLNETLPGSGRWTAKVVPREPGGCALIFHQGTHEIVRPLRVLRDEEVELADVTPDPNFLQRLAAATGGKMFTFERLPEVVPEINRITGQRPRRIERMIWCSPYFFGLVVGLLGVEWSLRKQWGLA